MRMALIMLRQKWAFLISWITRYYCMNNTIISWAFTFLWKHFFHSYLACNAKVYCATYGNVILLAEFFMKKAISLIVSGEIIHYYIPDFLHFYRGWCSKNCQCLRGWKGIPNGFYWSCPLRYGGKTFSHLLFGPFFKIFPANCTCLLIYIHLSLLTFLLSFKIEGMKVTTQPSFLLSLYHPRKKSLRVA